MTPRQALAFVRRLGVALESGHGSVPSVADAIAGERIKGSWWAHPQGKAIFNVTRALRDSEEILVCRLVGGKITFVHRRLWPALVRAKDHFRPSQLARLEERHTASGQHATTATPFPRWVPKETMREAKDMTEAAALRALGKSIPGLT